MTARSVASAPGRILSLVRVLRLTIAVVAALLSSACLVVSLQPVYEPETIAFDPALLGTWIASDDDMTVSFERGEWHSYHVTIAERDDRTRLSARLTRVGERSVSGRVAARRRRRRAAAVAGPRPLSPRAATATTLSLADLNYEQLERLARDGTAGLPMAIDARKNVVITASTAELRRWLVAHAADEGLFAAPTILRRKAAPDSPTPR